MHYRLDDWGRSLISLIVVAGFFAILILLLTIKLQGNTTPDVLLVLLGALGQAFGQVISYWVGSSSSSKQKDDTIQTISHTASTTASTAGTIADTASRKVP